MAKITINYKSSTLDLATNILMVIPEKADLSTCPVIFLLHGLSGDASNWTRYAASERYAMRHQVVLVMPEVQRSYYRDMDQGLDYFTYLTEELPAYLRRTFRLEGKLYVFGNSMGGYGALKCYFRRRDLFAGCASFSGVADIRARWRDVKKKDMPPVMKEPLEEDDIYALLAKETENTKVYLTCGTEDERLEMNKRLVALLEEKGFSYEAVFRPGLHNWDFWDKSLEDALQFFFPL